jgi:hypothetical protein
LRDRWEGCEDDESPWIVRGNWHSSWRCCSCRRCGSRTPQAARSDADVRIGRNASLTGEGGTALVRIRARCEPGWEVLEALVTVSQPQAFGEAFFPLSCDGRWARATIDVTSLDLPFEPGSATASALVLLTDPETEETSEAQDSVSVRL